MYTLSGQIKQYVITSMFVIIYNVGQLLQSARRAAIEKSRLRNNRGNVQTYRNN